MQDAARPEPGGCERPARTRLGEGAHTDHEPGLQGLPHSHEGAVASGEQRRELEARELVRRTVLSALLHEGERAVIDDEEVFEERRRVTVPIAGPTPEPGAAHLSARARETENGPARVLPRGASNGSLNAQEIPDHRHVAEGHPRLRHPEWARVHTEQEHSSATLAVEFQILLVRRAGVREGIVDVRGRRAEVQRVYLAAEVPAD